MGTFQTKGPTSTTSKNVGRGGVFGRYVESFLWLAAMLVLAAACLVITGLVFPDLLRVDPYRPQSDALGMILISIPISAIAAFIGCFLVFGLPQIVQASLHGLLNRSHRRYAHLTIVFFIPALAVLTWYCFDYLTPTDVGLSINADGDWQPYRHGISAQRYVAALAFQTPVSLFSLIYADPALLSLSRRRIVLLGIAVSAAIGVLFGHGMAEQQVRFIGQAQPGQDNVSAPVVAP